MRKQIIFALNYYVSEQMYGGVDHFVIKLATALLERGYAVDIFFPLQEGSSLFHYRKAGLDAELLAGDLFSHAVLERVRQKQYTLLVTHFFTPYSKYLKLYKTYVTHIISVEHMSRPIDGKQIKRKIKDKITYYLYRRYLDQTIHCCHYLRAQDALEYSTNIFKNSVTVYNGVESLKSEDTEELNRGKGQDGLRVVCIGRLVKEKGFEHAIEAVKMLNSSKISLEIYGDGNYKKDLQELCAHDKRIIFHGNVSTIPEVLRSADLLLLPSYQEAFPFVILEAFLYETLVVATRVGGIPEMLEDGVNGLLVPPKNSEAIAHILRRILDDPQAYKALRSAASITQKEHFSFAQMLQGHLGVVEEVISR